MDSVSKRCRKHFEKVSVGGNEDRISNLPTSLISHILSFLPTKNAVATSILSTKWKYLWTAITTLDFNDDVPRKVKQSSVKMSFINFVYRVLARNVSDLQKFHLRCIQNYDVSHLNVWVSSALSRNLRELHLSHLRQFYHREFHLSYCWILPREIFTCTTLVVLKLVGAVSHSFVLNVPTTVCLQNLKLLVIDSLRFLDDDSIYRFLSNCPVLEDLSIQKCDWRKIRVFNLSAPVLKSLTMSDYHYHDCDYEIVLNTPNLQDLKYNGYLAKDYSMNELNDLVKANICLDRLGGDGSECALGEFVDGISKVQWLHLSGSLMKTIELSSSWLPKFDRLTYLDLTGLEDEYAEWLLNFVESSPRLETLIFGGFQQDDEEEDDEEENQTTSHWNPPEQVPSCLLFHLKEIEIKVFEGENDELKMVEYFLENSRVLEKLVICLCHEELLDICKKLLMLPRGSKTCQVEIL